MHFSLDCSISLDELNLVCPETKAAVEAHEEFSDWSWLSFYLANGEAEELLPLVEALQKDFKDKTGMDLNITYIEDLEANWPNQFQHCLLEVDGAVDLTQEAKNYVEKYRRAANKSGLSSDGR